MNEFDLPKVRRDLFKVTSLFDRSDDKEYWLSKTPHQRLEAVELMRQIIYGDEAAKRLQRVLEIAHVLTDGQEQIIKRIDLRHLP